MADEQLVSANAMATTRRWLESFVAAEYSFQGFQIHNLRNLFCVSCMEGTLNASDFKQGQPHAGHPYLQVRKHTYRDHVVNSDDLGKFIDTACLQPHQTNSVLTFALRARKNVTLMRAPYRRRHFCANCNDTLSSGSPSVTLCSVECLVRASEQFPLTVKPDAPTAMEPPKRRNDLAGPSALQLQDGRRGKMPAEGERASKSAEDRELESATEEEKVTDAPTVMEPPKLRHDQAGPSSLHLQNQRTGKTPGEGEGASRSAAEDREPELATEEEKEAMLLQREVRASSESEEINETAAQFPLTVNPDAPTAMEPPKRRYDLAGPSSLHLQDRRTGKTPGEGEGASKSAEDRELLVSATEEETVASMLLQQDVRARLESEENAEPEGGARGRVISSARAEKMWSEARKATVDATSEQNPRFNGDDVERVRSVGTYARFMLSILGMPPSRQDRRPPEEVRDGAVNSAQPDIDAAENESSIADVLATCKKHQNAS